MTATDQPARDHLALAEDVLKIAIAAAILAASFYGSFRHVHEWTVTGLAGATGQTRAQLSWYGWANAVISELIPLAGLLSLRRRVAAGLPLKSYALGLVIGGAVLSIVAQIAWVCLAGHPTGSALFLAILPSVSAIVVIKLLSSDLDTVRAAKAEAAEADRKRLAMIADFRSQIDRAEEEARRAEEEARRAAESEAKARAEAEAARLRERNLRAEVEAEARRRAEAEAHAEAEAGREAARFRMELEQLRAKYDKQAGDLAAAQELLETVRPPSNVRQLRRSGGVHREIAAIPGELPPVKNVSAQLAARIAAALRDNPGATQAEIAQLVSTSDRSVREVVAVLKTMNQEAPPAPAPVVDLTTHHVS